MIRLKDAPPISELKNVILGEGDYLRLVKRGHWEYVERTNCSGIVVVLAVTDEGKLILIEQTRLSVRRPVIEFPAGLIGDKRHLRKENFLKAARRELEEETGFRAARIRKITQGPVSSGSSSDQMIVCRADRLRRVSLGGGDKYENIIVHEVPLRNVEAWLDKVRQKGCLVDPKVYMGLYFLRKAKHG